MIIDAHCHAWKRWPYTHAVPDIDTRGSVEMLLYELDRHGVDRAAVVCARIGRQVHPVCSNDDNNDYIAEAVARHPDRLTQVADVDSRWSPDHHRPGADKRLRAAVDRYGVTAITHYLHDHDDGWLDSDGGQAFLATAAELGLLLSLAVTPASFAAVRRAAARFPRLRLMLHHLGLVRLDDSQFESNLAELVALADVPNVFVKVSGFHYVSRSPHDYPYTEAAERFLRPLGTRFGPHRLVWGSDFPVAQPHVTYAQSLALIREHTPFWTNTDRQRVLGATMAQLL